MLQNRTKTEQKATEVLKNLGEPPRCFKAVRDLKNKLAMIYTIYHPDKFTDARYVPLLQEIPIWSGLKFESQASKLSPELKF